MKLVGLLAAALVALAGGAASARPPARAPAVTGVWTGKYVCGQGVTSLTLTIAPAAKGKVTATFRFGPLPENPTVPRGLYAMEGVFEPKTRRLQLKGVAWIDASSGYLMVDLEGRMDAPGLKLSGKVPFPGCSWFELRRNGDLVS